MSKEKNLYIDGVQVNNLRNQDAIVSQASLAAYKRSTAALQAMADRGLLKNATIDAVIAGCPGSADILEPLRPPPKPARAPREKTTRTPIQIGDVRNAYVHWDATSSGKVPAVNIPLSAYTSYLPLTPPVKEEGQVKARSKSTLRVAFQPDRIVIFTDALAHP